MRRFGSAPDYYLKKSSTDIENLLYLVYDIQKVFKAGGYYLMLILSYVMLFLLCFLIPWLISQIIRFISSFAFDPSFILTDSFILVSHTVTADMS